MKGVDGGGDVAAPTTDAPDPGAQPEAPDAVTGGGGSSQDTSYEPAPDPTACGQWVPAPVATGGDTPPEPINGPDVPDTTDSTTSPDATAATTPANQGSNWPEWSQQFTALGLSSDEIAKLGNANLSDEQLAGVYQKLYTGVVQAGGTPGQTRPGSIGQDGTSVAQSAWSPAWEQKFLALGLPADFVAELKAEADRTGAGEAQIQGVYDQLSAKVPVNQQAPGTQAPGTPGTQAPGTQAPGAADQGPGWNKDVAAAFKQLGMPDEVLKLYAQSGAPLSGLEAAYKHAKARKQDFIDRGWMQKFQDAKVPAIDTWSQILATTPAKDADLQKIVDQYHHESLPGWQKNAQLAGSLIPGGRLVQWIFGKKSPGGDSIDRFNPMEIGKAALSGLALFATIRGARTINAGWSARAGGYSELKGVGETMSKLGLPSTGTDALEQTAIGSTTTWGAKQKLISLIPGTQLHKEIVGLGHAEAAARAFNHGGAELLAHDTGAGIHDGALQLATTGQMFSDIASGATKIEGSGIAYLPFGKKVPMTLNGDTITVARNLKIGSGNTQLAALMDIGGQKLGTTPDWLQTAPQLGADIAKLSAQTRLNLGSMMAGSAARDLGASAFAKDAASWSRSGRYVSGLLKRNVTAEYANLAATTAEHLKLGMPHDLLELQAGHALFSKIFAEGATGIAGLDRSALTPETSALVDDVAAKMASARTAMDAAQAGGKLDDATLKAMTEFHASAEQLGEADAALAKQLLPTYADQGAFVTAEQGAIDAAQAAWKAEQAAATAATPAVADAAGEIAAEAAAELPQAAAPVADTVAAPIADAVSGATQVVHGPMTQAEAAAAAAATPTASIPLRVTNAGEAVTPSGLIVPSYATSVTGVTPSPQEIARFQDMVAAMRNA
jgi:hypothetical protein